MGKENISLVISVWKHGEKEKRKIEEIEKNTCLFSICLAKIIFVNSFYYSVYF